MSAQMDRWLCKRVRQDSDTDAEDPAGLSSIRAVLSLNTSSTAPEQPVSVQLKLVSNTGTQVCDRSKPHLVLTLQHEDEQEAAMAVLASMYKVKPLPELLSELTQVQQLQAAVLADVWGLPEVSTEAVRLLLAAADKGAGLSYELVMHYAQMQAVPSCLVRLLPKIVAVCLDSSTEHTLSNFRSAAQQAVLTVLGDLNAVSADAALLQQLLDLPLDMMQLLVSSSLLKVDSEATVMYAAQHYINKLKGEPKAAAIQVLGPRIRCQFLSSSWLTSVAEGAVWGTARLSLKSTHSLPCSS